MITIYYNILLQKGLTQLQSIIRNSCKHRITKKGTSVTITITIWAHDHNIHYEGHYTRHMVLIVKRLHTTLSPRRVSTRAFRAFARNVL